MLENIRFPILQIAFAFSINMEKKKLSLIFCIIKYGHNMCLINYLLFKNIQDNHTDK